MDDSAFTVWQSHLVSRLGVTIEEVREARKHLVEEVDFAMVKNRVVFTEKGAHALASALGLPGPLVPKLLGPGAMAEENGALPCDSLEKIKKNGNGVHAFLVHRKTGNPNIMEAYAPGCDPAVRSNLVRIRVKDSGNFMRGMKVEARPCAAQGLYEFTGRLPRWPGKY